MEATDLPMFTSFSNEHPLKAREPMEVTESGILIEVIPLQLLKALLPISLRASLKVTVSRSSRPSKALLPMEVSFAPEVNDLSEEHPLKALEPIEVTESGSVISERGEQSRKAS